MNAALIHNQTYIGQAELQLTNQNYNENYFCTTCERIWLRVLIGKDKLTAYRNIRCIEHGHGFLPVQDFKADSIPLKAKQLHVFAALTFEVKLNGS